MSGSLSTFRDAGIPEVSRRVCGFGRRLEVRNRPLARLLFDESPALPLKAALGGIENHELASLLELGVSHRHILAFVVIVQVFGGRFVGIDPFR